MRSQSATGCCAGTTAAPPGRSTRQNPADAAARPLASWMASGLPAGQASFQATAQFGGSETEDIGKEFGLLLALASKEASDIFRIFQAKESSRGLRELPEGTRTLDQVRVIRR